VYATGPSFTHSYIDPAFDSSGDAAANLWALREALALVDEARRDVVRSATVAQAARKKKTDNVAAPERRIILDR
jgi:hypothetical protein